MRTTGTSHIFDLKVTLQKSFDTMKARIQLSAPVSVIKNLVLQNILLSCVVGSAGTTLHTKSTFLQSIPVLDTVIPHKIPDITQFAIPGTFFFEWELQYFRNVAICSGYELFPAWYSTMAHTSPFNYPMASTNRLTFVSAQSLRQCSFRVSSR